MEGAELEGRGGKRKREKQIIESLIEEWTDTIYDTQTHTQPLFRQTYTHTHTRPDIRTYPTTYPPSLSSRKTHLVVRVHNQKTFPGENAINDLIHAHAGGACGRHNRIAQEAKGSSGDNNNGMHDSTYGLGLNAAANEQVGRAAAEGGASSWASLLVGDGELGEDEPEANG